MRTLIRLIVWSGASALAVAAFVAVAGSQVLPPGTDSDCAGQVPIVVASDEAAQSDLYSAATLAGVIETSCVVLAGPRDGEFPADQLARLDAALADSSGAQSTAGWVMGGEAAVPEAKVAGRGLKRLDGVDRWHTARLAGAIAADPDGDVAALTEATAPAEGELGGGSVIVDGVEVRLPPGLDAPCDGQVPIVVAVDAAAQSDLYSAATLAGVLDTTCYVLAGARGEPMSDEQRARLEAASGDGWIVGGEAAVPLEKVEAFELERQGGADRWATARLIGATAVEQAAVAPADVEPVTTTTTERVVRRVSSGGGGSSRSGGSRTPTRTPPPVVTVPPGTTSTTTTTEPMSTTTTTMPDDTTTTTEPPRMASMFTPSVSVEVPQLAGTTGTNIWAGETFEVTLATASDADADCSGVDETLTFTVQDSGVVMLTAGTVPAMLIGTLADGTTTCEYTVTFGEPPTAASDPNFAWTMTAPVAATLDADNTSAQGRYAVGAITFDPVATITVPAGSDGAAFDVDFASTQANCSGNPTAVTHTYTVPTGGTAAAPAAANSPLLIAYPAGATASTDVCSYAVTFPPNENGNAMALVLQTGADVTATGTDQVISATYEPAPMASMFMPSVTVEVPLLDAMSNVNLWAAAEVQVTIARDATMTATDCSLPSERAVTFTVQIAGTVTPNAAQLPTELVGTTAGGDVCAYTVTFGAPPTAASDPNFAWTMTAPAAATLDADNTSAQGRYAVGAITFDPVATITVPPNNDGAAFDVDFASTQPNCSGNPTALTHTYTVPTGGTAAAPAAANSPLLIAYPTGATASTDVCSYTVTFPTNENGDAAALALLTTGPAPDTTATGTDQAISATYESTALAKPEPAGLFDREVEWVLFERTTAETMTQDPHLTWTVTPSHEDCWVEDVSRVRIYDVHQGTAIASPDLARTEAGSTTECSYTFTFPTDEDGPWARWERIDFSSPPARAPYTGADSETVTPCAADTDTNDVDRCTPAISVAYQRAAASRFVPQVAISVPDTPADGFVGETFDVTFTQMGSTPANCSGSDGTPVTQTYTVPAGSTTAVATGAIELLVSDPDTSAAGDLCVYTVTFPPAFTVTRGDSTMTVLDNDGEATARIVEPTLVSRSYSARTPQPSASFTPTISVSVPPLVGTTPNENIWKDQAFEVTIVRASGTSADCSLSESETLTYAVDAAGAVATSDTVPTLVGTTAGSVTCEYTVTFPASPMDDDSDDFDWTMLPSAATTATVSDASMETRLASVEYTVGDVTFEPDATITVPARSEGKRFSVGFTGSGADCPDETLIYAVEADGTTVVPVDANEPLVAYAAGATAMTAVCSYTAAFPSTETDATRLALATTATDDTTATGTDQAIAATYELAMGPLQGSTADAPRAYAPVFTQVSVGGRFACGLMSDGTTSCWGRNKNGAISELPAESFKQVAAGDEHVCAVKADDTIACWGASAAGGGNVPSAQASVAFEQVVAGDVHTCARKADGSVVCWGWSGYGGALLAVPASTTFSSISASFDHTCGIRSGGATDGTVVCWGWNGQGQRVVPAAEASTTFSSISAGEAHTCGVRSAGVPGGPAAGSIVCWGSSGDGRSTVPAAEASSTFTQVSAGYAHTCALRDDGTIACWGSNLLGEATAPSGTFVAVDAGQERSCGVRADGSVTCWGYGNTARAMPPAGAFSHLSAGTEHTCGVRSAAGPGGEAVGTVACWGSNGPAELEDNRAMPPTDTFSQVAAGSEHTCGVRAAAGAGGEAVGTVACWGDNAQGQLTLPTGEAASTFTSISAGNLHTCGLKDDNDVVCWGSDIQGQTTVPDPGVGRSFASVSAGWSHTCAVLDNNNVLCWGSNGDGKRTVPSGEMVQSHISVSAGGDFTCAIRDNNSLACWGNNQDGRTAPPAGSFTAISVGRYHACALRDDGTVACWGDSSFGATDAPRGVFAAVTSGDGYSCGTRVDGTVICWGAGTAQQSVRGPLAAVSSGDTFSCALRVDGRAFCWGDNRHGQLAAPEGTFTQVDVGTTHACGLKTDNSVACWGDNTDGQATVTELTGGRTFTAVSAGQDHSCALVSDGTAVCWGDSGSGRTTPTVLQDDDYVALSTGAFHSCGLTASSSIECWGYNGPGSNPDRRVSGVPDAQFQGVAVGESHSCGLKVDGDIVCWGRNSVLFAPPDGRVSDVPEEKFLSVTAGAHHTCGLKTDQTVACWGRDGDLGSPDRRVSGVPDGEFVSVAAGTRHTCGLRPDGSVACWGYLNNGQTTTPAGSFDTVSAGERHSCGVETDGTAVCWGSNDDGRATPPALEVGESFTQVAAGRGHSCGLHSDSTAVCWGSNGDGAGDGRVSRVPSGALTSVTVAAFHSCGVLEADGEVTCWGNSNLGRTNPPALETDESYTVVSAGWEHTCALKDDKSVVCWGLENVHHDRRVSDTPSGATDLFTAVSAGREHSCALRETSGEVVCWGSNRSGQSADPTGAFSAVAAGGFHTCALRSGGATDGTIACWGDNTAGQTEAPEGTFDALSAGDRHSCAVRTGGDDADTVVCWGAGAAFQLITGRPPVS